jgi:hypothetical protein
MAGIRKCEIVGLTLVVALFGVVTSPAFALTADLGQTSVSTDTAANLVERASTGSSPTSGGGDAVRDMGKAITDTSGVSPQTNVDVTYATGSAQPAAQTGSNSPPLEQPSAQTPSGVGGKAVTDLSNAAGQTTGAEPQPKADPAPVAPAPKALTPLTSKAPKVVDAVQKDVSTTVAGAVAGGGGPPASGVPDKPPANLGGAPADAIKTLTNTAAMLTQDPVGTAPALVDGVQKDASTVVGIVAGGGTPPGVPGGGGLPGLGGAITYMSQALDPVIAILKDPVRLVSATVQQLLPASTGLLDLAAPWSQPPLVSGLTSSLAAPIGPISESPLSGQLPFAGSSPGPGQPPPGAHAGLLPSEQVIARGLLTDPRYSGATARGATSGAGTMRVDGMSLSIRSLRLLGVGSGSSSAVDRTGTPFPKLPGTPPQPKLPALGGMSFSTLLSFGSFAALAVLLASIAARSGFIRRLALARGRPVGFALLLERPG